MPQDLSNFLWASASLRCDVPLPLDVLAARAADLRWQHFKPQENRRIGKVYQQTVVDCWIWWNIIPPENTSMTFEVEKSCCRSTLHTSDICICLHAAKEVLGMVPTFCSKVVHRLLTFICFDLGHGIMTVMDQKGCTFGPQQVQSDVHEPHSCCSNRTTGLACTYAH